MTIEAQVAAGLQSGLKELQDKVGAELQSTKDALKQSDANLLTAKQSAETLGTKVKDLEAQVTKLQGEVTAATDAKSKAEADLAASNKKLTETENSVEQRAGLKAAAIEAGRGVTTPVKEEAGKENPASDKPANTLKGINKVRAAIRAELGIK